MCDMADQEQLRRQNHIQIEEEQEELQQQQQNVMQLQEQPQTLQQQRQDPRTVYRERTEHMQEHARGEKTGFKARFSRTKRPLEQLPPEAPASQTFMRTGEEATHTYSDQQSNASRELLAARIGQLRNAGFEEIAEAVSLYVQGTRYRVGYTQERKRLMNAMKLVKDSLDKAGLSVDQRAILDDVKAYFDTMTNGTLEISPDEEILDFSNEKPKETGRAVGGSKRNKAIRTFSTWKDQRDMPLFSHEPVINDLKQRLVSNCYMMASIGGLVECDPALIKQCIKDNDDGTVTVRLFERRVVSRPKTQQDGGEDDSISEDFDDFEFIEEDEIEKTELVPVYVRVKKEVPRVMGGVDALSAGALWMQMIEKACAHVGRNGRTGYQSLWYGEGGEFLERLLGISRVVDMDSTSDKDQLIASNELFEKICNARDHRVIYNAGSSQKGADGLNSGHAYTVMGGTVRDGQRLVLLRNPYSMHSLQYNKDGSRSMSDSMFSTSSDETYGQFYMKFEDFIHDFDKITHTDLNR